VEIRRCRAFTDLHLEQGFFADFGPFFWASGRRPPTSGFRWKICPVFRQFFCEKKLRNSPLNLTVGGPLVGHAFFFGQKLARIFPEKGSSDSPDTPRTRPGQASNATESVNLDEILKRARLAATKHRVM